MAAVAHAELTPEQIIANAVAQMPPSDELASIVAKAIKQATQLERSRCARISVNVGRRKVSLAVKENAPRPYTVGIEATYSDIEHAIIHGEQQ